MKTITKTTAIIASLFALAGCASTGGVGVDATTAIGTANNVGMAVFQTAVDQTCRVQLTNNTVWRTASIAMTDQQKITLQDNVCGCVSQNAVKNVNIVDLATAATNPTARTQIVTQAVANTLQTCVVQALSAFNLLY